MANSKNNDLNIETHKVDKVSNEKTSKQENDAKEIKAKMESEAKKAKEAIEAANEAKIETKSEPKIDTEQSQAILAAGTTIAKAIKKNKSGKGFFKGLLIGVVIGAILMSIFSHYTKTTLLGKIDNVKDTVDNVIDSTFFGYTAADFQEAILGEATGHQELIVMEVPLEVPTTITKAGLGNLAIFTKMKTITYYGTGIYTVDLSKLTAEKIEVNENDKEVTVRIPHATLQYVNPELDKTEFEDTEKGLLAFGDIKLTTEQLNEVETSIVNSMRNRLEQHDLYEQADEYAVLKTWELFQPLITSVSPQYVLKIDFE